MAEVEDFLGEEAADYLAELASDYREQVEEIVAGINSYPEAELREKAIQSLMETSDELMESYQAEKDEVLPEFEKLDDLFWDWFQSPPEPEELATETKEILQSAIAKMAGSTAEASPESAAEETEEAEPESEPDTSENEPAESATAAAEPAEESAVAESGEGNFATEIELEPELADDFLTEVNEKLETLDNLLVKIENNPAPDTLKVLARAMHTLKGGFGMCGLDIGSNVCHAAEDLLEELKEEPPDTVPAIWMDLFFASVDSLRVICTEIESAMENETQQLEIPLSAEYLELMKEDLRKACAGETDEAEFVSLEQSEARETGEEEEADQELGEEKVNIGMNQIEEIVDLVGELVISHSEIDEIAGEYSDRQLENALSRQDKILSQLQNRSMKLRMLPLRKEFRKFPRIVRDLARELDKKIEFNVKGGETEIDKSVLSQLHGPLVHMIRNAVDHGIESPEVRREKGKPETGQLELRAYQEGENIYIEVEEDGAGLDRDEILESAIEKGIVESGEELEPEEIDQLIFNSGFSTTDELSEVSGRGVGMDVVASEIRSMRGNVYIDSTPGEGTKFTVELPLTVAIIEGLIVRLGPDRMILPLSQVEEVINPDQADLQQIQDAGWALKFRDDFIPVIEPGNIMEEVEPIAELDKRSVLVVLDAPQGQFALRIDELIAPEQVVIKSLRGTEEQKSEMVSGAAILGDGSVGLIVDVAGLVHKFHQQDLPPQMQGTGDNPVIM